MLTAVLTVATITGGRAQNGQTSGAPQTVVNEAAIEPVTKPGRPRYTQSGTGMGLRYPSIAGRQAGATGLLAWNKAVNRAAARSAFGYAPLKSNYVDEDQIRSQGITGILEGGFISGFGNYSLQKSLTNGFSAWTLRGQVALIVHHQLTIGVGSGIENYGTFRNIPLFADFRYSFRQGRSTPYLSINGGALLCPDTVLHQGSYIGANLGGKVYVSNDVSVQLGAGYRIETIYFTAYTDDAGQRQQFRDYSWLQFLTFSIGVAF